MQRASFLKDERIPKTYRMLALIYLTGQPMTVKEIAKFFGNQRESTWKFLKKLQIGTATKCFECEKTDFNRKLRKGTHLWSYTDREMAYAKRVLLNRFGIDLDRLAFVGGVPVEADRVFGDTRIFKDTSIF